MSVTNTYSMRRPIVLITFILIGGIAIGSCTEIPLYFTIGIGFIAWMCCLTTFAVRKFNKYVFPCLGLFFIVTSIAYYDSRTALLPANHLEHVLSTHKSLHRIAGTIINPPILWDENILNKHVHLMKSERNSKKIRLQGTLYYPRGSDRGCIGMERDIRNL